MAIPIALAAADIVACTVLEAGSMTETVPEGRLATTMEPGALGGGGGGGGGGDGGGAPTPPLPPGGVVELEELTPPQPASKRTIDKSRTATMCASLRDFIGYWPRERELALLDRRTAACARVVRLRFQLGCLRSEICERSFRQSI